jgi:hypothetical protein
MVALVFTLQHRKPAYDKHSAIFTPEYATVEADATVTADEAQ